MTAANDALTPLAGYLDELDRRSSDNAGAVTALQDWTEQATDALQAASAQIRAAFEGLDARVTALEGGTVPPPSGREIGVTEPTAANTGLNGSPGGPRSRQDGDLICQPDTTYEDIDVADGHVVLAPGCTVRRVTATGRALDTGTYYSSIFWGADAEGALVEDCVARPTAATARVSLNGFGWSGTGYTAIWNDVSGVTDLFHGTGPGMMIYANYTHDYRFDAHDPDQSGGWCHPDGVQVLGGDRVEIIGNAFHMNYDPELSAGVDELLADPDYAQAWGGGFGNVITLTLKNQPLKGFRVRQNWMYGGEVQFQMPKQGKGYDTGNDGELSGNRVSVQKANRWHGGASAHHFRADSGTGNVVQNEPNVYLDTTDRPTVTVQPAPGVTLPGTYGTTLSVKTQYA
jgi:hypothetical protein